jgi:predicted transcriptional regulator
MERRGYDKIESAIVIAIKKFGTTGASINEIAMEAKTNWKTTRSFIERLYNWGVINKVTRKKQSVYRWNAGP